MTNHDDTFLPQERTYRTLKCFQKAECIYDITYYFAHQFLERNDRTIANIAITLIHQCDVLIVGLIEWLKQDFKEKGGIKEQMYKARKDWQQKNWEKK